MHDWTEHNPLSVFVWGAVKHPGKPRDKIRENIFRTTYQISLTMRVHPYHTCNERNTPACSFRGITVIHQQLCTHAAHHRCGCHPSDKVRQNRYRFLRVEFAAACAPLLL